MVKGIPPEEMSGRLSTPIGIWEPLTALAGEDAVDLTLGVVLEFLVLVRFAVGSGNCKGHGLSQ